MAVKDPTASQKFGGASLAWDFLRDQFTSTVPNAVDSLKKLATRKMKGT